ncbi:MAG: rhodanese-related sulfurtransferase [Synechococcales cyanobacterium CRU_2_2]|nr:rhodanese-related sulfurtransferase [Synechococcales cyanobacterium CRU_2_2]
MTYLVTTFYRFVPLPDCAELREPLLQACLAGGVGGTILLAEEGINGTIAGEPQSVQSVLAFLAQDERFRDLPCREAWSDRQPFQRTKVKLKSEIVTLGQPHIRPLEQAGIYVEPEDWNPVILDPEVLVIDTRNEYEVKLGSFRNAVNPHTESFRAFPDYVQRQLHPQRYRKIAMFCTGGIRCEKASAYLRTEGFEVVYHLKGGILNYLEKIPADQSLWEGECFVFDERVAVKQGLEVGNTEMCGCGQPISAADKASEFYQFGRCCPQCRKLPSLEP